MNDIIFYLVAGHRRRLAVRLARHRPRRRLQGLRRHQLRPGGDGDVRHGHVRPGVEPGGDLPPVGRPPADPRAQPARCSITLSDSGEVPMGVALVIALAMAALLGLGAHFLVFRPLRHAAPLGKVVASLGLALYLQGVALLNFGTSYPTPKSVYPNPNSAFDELPRPRQPVPPQQPVRLLRRRHPRRHRVGGLQVHPLRHGDPRRGEQREGRRPARLLAAAAGRHQLGRRLDARHAGRHPRRPDPGPDHARSA